MRINNKEFGEWTADDLQVLLSNDAYRENNFIDYKVNFAPLLDKNNKKEKQAEFRNDVCSFANADGGYIFYGIGETCGTSYSTRTVQTIYYRRTRRTVSFLHKAWEQKAGNAVRRYQEL